MRVAADQAYVLHRYPYGETSLLLELLTRHHGRVAVIAKGVRKPKSTRRALLDPFVPLQAGWSGRGEVATLGSLEAEAAGPVYSGERIFCGFYLNELLLRLLHRHDPHERLFDAYAQAVAALADPARDQGAVLRVFEKRLLEEVGYGLVLTHEVADNAPITSAGRYRYLPDQGPVPEATAGGAGIAVSGATLLALAAEDLIEVEALSEAKRLMRQLLAPHLGGKPLQSRRLFEWVHGLAAREPEGELQ